MSKLIIIDNGNIMHRAIFAFRNHSQCPASFTYLRMIIGYLKKLGATLDDKIILADDFGSWRKEIDKNYKSQRKAYRESKESEEFWEEMYQEFNDFFVKLDNCLPFNRIKIYKIEADDIASMAVRYLEADEKILVSSDEDWQMLCTIPNVKVFSPYSKKYKEVKYPEKILIKKIRGDKSDNLLTIPQTEAEWEKRKMIVDLIHLPQHIEQIIKPIVENLPIKNLLINKVPFHSCREELKKLYHLEN